MISKPFVVLSSQRTGSTLLVRSIDQHPELFCAGEIFHYRDGIHHNEWRFPYKGLGNLHLSMLWNRFFSGNKVKMHLKAFYENAENPFERARGFKLMLSQIDWNPNVLPYLVKNGVQIMVLVRNSDAETALSSYSAMLSGQYHSSEKQEGGLKENQIVSKEDFLPFLNRAKKNRERLLNISHSTCASVYTYEELVNNWDETLDRFGRELGFGSFSVPQALKKVRTNQKRIISNADELLKAFA